MNTAHRRPDWLKIKLNTSDDFQETKDIISKQMLNTVCVEAKCPNIYECWNRRTATIMFLGDTFTRSCGFCSVKTGKPSSIITAIATINKIGERQIRRIRLKSLLTIPYNHLILMVTLYIA